MIKTTLLMVWLVLLSIPSFLKNDYQNQANVDSLKIIEKVYVHTDRYYYTSGDDLWFKAYLIDATDRTLTSHSKNLHVDLISPTFKIISSRTIRIENGLGNGDFMLPRDLSPGQYRLRAYTNYMKNFDDEGFFFKDIFIINPTDTINKQIDSVMFVDDKIHIDFFPEGGSLVDDISSTIAFKAVDAIGIGSNVTGEIYSSKGDLVTTFKSAHCGMGNFIIKPTAGLIYSAIVKNVSGNVIKAELPKAFSKGVALTVFKNEKNKLTVTVKTNPNTLPLILNNDLILNISARGTPLMKMSFRIKGLVNNVSIPTDVLPDGIIMLTLSASENLPLCERLIYLQKNDPINAKIDFNKIVFKPRDSVSLKISLVQAYSDDEKAFLSLSAVESNSLNNQSLFPTNISSWFLLESDVHGEVEEPSYYFDPSNQNRLEDLDLLLLTQGWRDFEWKYKKMNYLPENGFTVSGRLRKLFVDKQLTASIVSVGLFENDNTLITNLQTDSTGRFQLAGIDFAGDAILAVSSVGERKSLMGQIILDSVKYLSADIKNEPLKVKLRINSIEPKFEGESMTNYNIRKNYKLSDTINLTEVKVVAKKTNNTDPQTFKVIKNRAIYGIPDNELIITPSMELTSNAIELLIGRIPGVQVFGSFPDYRVTIRGPGSNISRPPLFLLDGHNSSLEDILTIPVSSIDRIDILKGSIASTFGIRGGNGVIAVITRTADRYAKVNKDPYSLHIKISGFDTPRVFYSPDHSLKTASAYKPDLRTTLFWVPNITLNSNNDTILRYFNADNSTSIKVNVEGMTTSGVPISASTTYEIK